MMTTNRTAGLKTRLQAASQAVGAVFQILSA